MKMTLLAFSHLHIAILAMFQSLSALAKVPNSSLTHGEPGSGPQLVVDIHTHFLPPSYVDLLASRNQIPYIYRPATGSPRLIILPSEDDQSKPVDMRGRPLGTAFFTSLDAKCVFMNLHGITTSVVALPSPWLDFLPATESAKWARIVNDELEEFSAKVGDQSSNSTCKIFAFGTLPLSASLEENIAEISRLKALSNVKGIMIGPTGLGRGLDDSALSPVWQHLEKTKTIIFLHPKYGLPETALGGPEVVARSGTVLPLALGFPLETTIAVSRMFLAGVFDRFPDLKIILAHAGGTVPFLAGRIQMSVEHEREFVANGGLKQGPQNSIWDVLQRNIYLDAVVYSEPGLKAAVEAGDVGRVMFGTDHPFFPPLRVASNTSKWPSVEWNYAAVRGAFGADTKSTNSILGENAVRILGLQQ
jgi:predicted TIM-barrel fold metal-dependent hydrolase